MNSTEDSKNATDTLIIRKMQAKSTLRSHLPPFKLAKPRKSADTFGRDIRKWVGG